MAKKPTPNFETTLKELESIVTHLESGDLSLEDALNELIKENPDNKTYQALKAESESTNQ